MVGAVAGVVGAIAGVVGVIARVEADEDVVDADQIYATSVVVVVKLLMPVVQVI
jgi:hypothetical protein